MKNMKTHNRISLKPALFALCLGLLASAPVMAHASDKQATSGSQTVQTTTSKSIVDRLIGILYPLWWIRR